MRYWFCLLLGIIFLCDHSAYAQACTPDPSHTEFGIYTSDPSGLPDGCEGEFYSEVITAVIPDSLAGYPLISVTILTVNGLPDSMDYDCNPSTCVFAPDTSACVVFEGTPHETGVFSISVTLRVKVQVIIFPVTVDTTFVIGDFTVEAKDCAGICGGTAAIDSCGICSGGTTGKLPNCNDNLPCTADQCDGAGGCINTDICVTISGAVLTESAKPVKGVTLTLSGSDAQLAVTGANGLYNFEVIAGGSYIITPSKTNDSLVTNGISTADILLIRRHVLVTDTLDSPYKIIAADGFASGTVLTSDILITRSVILGNATTFTSGRLWEFINSNQVFGNPLNPFPFEKTRTYSNLLSDQTNQNFIGVKLGDVNNDWNPGTP